MSHHSAEIVGLKESANAPSFRERDSHNFTAQAGIVVRPPIVAGEGLRRAVLGIHTDNKTILGGDFYLDMKHVLTTPDESIFTARARTPYAETSVENIQTVAARILEVAANPARVVEMQDEDAFHSPYSVDYPELNAIIGARLVS